MDWGSSSDTTAAVPPGVSRTFIDFGDVTVWAGPDGVVKRLDALFAYDVDSVDPADLLAEIDEISMYESKLAAIKATRLAAYEQRRVHRPAFRSPGTALAHRQQRSVHSVGRELSTAGALMELPAVLEWLARGLITPDHVQAIVRLHRRPELADAVERDQEWMVGKALRESWPEFTRLLAQWAELNDERDPRDLDPAHDERKLLMGKGIGGAAFAELLTTTFCLEQIQEILTPIYERLEAEEWADVRARLGDAATANDLPRRPAARWHDALMIALRSGGTGDDPGVKVGVHIVVDLITVMMAAQLSSEHDMIVFHPDQPPVEPDSAACEPEWSDSEWSDSVRRIESGVGYRSHTGRGHPVSPFLALWCTLACDIRRVTLGLTDDGTATSTTGRIFTPKQKIGIRIRDCHCRGPGCATPAANTQADHVVPHDHGGPTTTSNGQSLCGPCHRHKTWLQSIGLHDELGFLWDFHHNPN